MVQVGSGMVRNFFASLVCGSSASAYLRILKNILIQISVGQVAQYLTACNWVRVQGPMSALIL